MALQFPSSASIGQTYQSGSSPIYTYNGSVWALSSGNTGIANLNEYTASLRLALQTTGSNATMLGNLNVQGTQTALNQASLQITDKFIRVASGSLSSAQSNGAGFIIDGANVTMSWDSSNSQITFNTQISASSFIGDGSGLTGVTSYTNSDNLAYLNSKGVISGSSQVVGILSSLNTYTGSNDTKWSTLQNVTSSLISATGSYETRGRGIVSGSSQLTSSFDTRYAPSASYITSINGAISSSTQVTNGSGIISSSAQLPSGIISGSSQLTSSFDTRYTLSGSISSVPSGTVSGSSQLTSSYDLRYALSGSGGSIPAGTISGSSQLTSSFDTRYLNTGGDGVISGSSQLTSSYDGRYTLTSSFNSFTASAQTVTTGSNSFNGTQTITGSLVITSGSFIGSNITANTSSLYLTSGSNMYVQNNGIVEITGSLIVSGSSTFKNNLTIGTGVGAEGGQIDLVYAASGNTTLTGSSVSIDVFGDKVRIFENGGTNRGVSIDLSKTPASVGADLMWKTSGLINTGSFVQLDNIKAGPTRTGAGGGYAGLSIGAVSTSFVADVSAVYSNNTTGGQTITGTTYTTTAANAWNGWGFTQGQQSTYILYDTTNSRVYRIILMIGASYNNNFTSIERLY